MIETNQYSIFESELSVRPDDIDMYNHVHNSKYLDYVQAARYEQMEISYSMHLKDFKNRNLGWITSQAVINFKRPLLLGEKVLVRTGVLILAEKSCTIQFKLLNKKTQKLISDGTITYMLVDLKSNRSLRLPVDIINTLSI